MKAAKSSARKILQNPKYRDVRREVTIEGNVVSVARFFHCDDLEQDHSQLSADERDDLLREHCRSCCQELFAGTEFQHTDNGWAHYGARVVIYSLDYKARNFEKDLTTVLTRMAMH